MFFIRLYTNRQELKKSSFFTSCTDETSLKNQKAINYLLDFDNSLELSKYLWSYSIYCDCKIVLSPLPDGLRKTCASRTEANLVPSFARNTCTPAWCKHGSLLNGDGSIVRRSAGHNALLPAAVSPPTCYECRATHYHRLRNPQKEQHGRP